MTVASRIVKLESQITYLERKLDHLINVYRKDQQRLKRADTACSNDEDNPSHQQTVNSKNNNSNNANNNNNNAGNNNSTSNNNNNDNSSSNNNDDALTNLLAPLYQREGVNKSSMSLLSPDIPGKNTHSDRRMIKNRSSSQPASMENLRSISDTTQSTTSKSFNSKQSGFIRPTNIKIPAFFDKLPNKFQ